MSIAAIGTYLPPWGSGAARVQGRDEDALTMAVQAGRAALGALGAHDAGVDHVVFVTRDLPLLDGGNGAALVAGLGLPTTTTVVEQIGGAPAVLDALLAAAPDTLVIGADTGTGSGAAAAVLNGGTGLALTPVARVLRSLPVRARGSDGEVHDYDDPRLVRERGIAPRSPRRASRGRPSRPSGCRPRTRLRCAKVTRPGCPPPARARRCSRSRPWPRRVRTGCCSRSSRRR